MYARDDQPLPPILSDGLWTVPFEFFSDTGRTQPLDQTGTTWDLKFAPKGRSQPAAADVHVLSTAASGGLTVAGSVVTASWSDWAAWAPGVYTVEFRQTNLGAPIPVYVGTVTLARGLSDVASLGGGSVLPGQPAPAVQLIVGPTAVQIVRGEASESALRAAASATLAQQWAALVGAFVTGSLLSAQEWAVGTFKRGVAGFGSSKDWASLTGQTVDDTAYSAKELAVGSTTPTGSAMAWATAVGGAVITGFYSAKEWAVGTFTRGQSGGGSARDWASYTGGTVDDVEFSAKKNATDAAAYRSQTANDAVATAADRTATRTDRQAADADAAQVSADKTTTQGYRDQAQAASDAFITALAAIQGSMRALTPTEVTTAGYNVTAADAGKLLVFTSALRTIVYVDALPAAAAQPVGLMRAGLGTVEVRPGLVTDTTPAAGAGKLEITTSYKVCVLQRVLTTLSLLFDGDAALPALGIDRASFDDADASGLALLYFS